jgi:hypothetical protein
MIKSTRMIWTGHVARMEKRNACTILVGKPEGNNPLGRSRRKWEDNIKMDLRETGLFWLRIGDQRTAVVNKVMTFAFHKMLGNS